MSSIPCIGVITREEAMPLVAPDPPPIPLVSLFFIIFWSFWIPPCLSLPPAIPRRPRPFPVSLNSYWASAPNAITFVILRVIVIWYFSLRFLNFLPPLFFLTLSSGFGSGFLSLGYYGAMTFSNLARIPSLSFFPSDPFEQVPHESILAASAVLVASILMICIENLGGAVEATSTS